MVVSAVTNQLLADNNLSNNTNLDYGHNISSVGGTASNQDVAAFQSILQGSLKNTVLGTMDPNSTFFATTLGHVLSGAIDDVEHHFKKMKEFSSNLEELNMKQFLELQKSAEHFTVSVQLLSKCVSSVVKAIDGLTHIQ